MEWRNWSANVTCEPARVEAPGTEAEVQAVVRRAAADGLAVRPLGSGHSFSPLCSTTGVALDLAALAGVEAVDADRGTATVRAGTRLAALGAPLHAAGLALHNQGDVDTQTVAGAIGTATHGTGPDLGSLSSAVVGLRLVTADGDRLECSAEHRPDLLAAGACSLGALGVVTAVTLRLVPAYNLHERIWFEGPEESLARLEERIGATRHYEFFWWPGRDLFEHKALTPTDLPPDPLPAARRERIDASHRVFPSPREERFNEIEYAVPLEAGPACFAELRDRLRREHPEVLWPVEYRTLGPDTAWLGPGHGRASATISVHQDAALPYEDCFRTAESVLLAHDGRPHWGKVHWRTASELAPHYERWDDFWALRAELDPGGRFLNEHLRRIGGC